MGIVHQLLEFYDAPAAASFTLPPAEALAYFRSKGLRATFDWRDLLGAEHASAFTVAKMADLDMLADIQASLDAALADGLSFRSWSDTITPMLQAKGWWGRQAVTDPLTGETIVAQLGSPSRLQTIFRTNVQSAYAAGQWQQIQDNADVAEYLLYDAIDDHRTRPQHAEWDGTVLPATHEWWATHYPPNGWNCRCGVIQLSAEELEELGLKPSPAAPPSEVVPWKNPRTGKTEKVIKGLDPGWNSNPGATHLADLKKLALQKIAQLTAKASEAATAGMAKAQQQASAAAQAAAEASKAAEAMKVASKAQERAAAAAIDAALKAKTPYLAKAIQKLQAGKATKGLSAPDLLEAAKLEATKVKDSAALANWKQAQLAGKPGAPAGQAVFDALPEAAQASILADIEAQLASKAAAQAIDTELAAIAAGDKGALQASNLAKVKAANPDLPPAEILAQVQAMPAQLTPGQLSGGLAGWKKNAIAGKAPTEKQQLAFDSLTDKQKAKALAQVDEAKTAAKNEAIAAAKALEEPEVDPVTGLGADQLGDEAAFFKMQAEANNQAAPGGSTPASAVDPDIHPDSLRQTGPQRGSNPGGTFIDEETGVAWYIKWMGAEDAARNEVLASKLYAAAGVDAPDYRFIWHNGKPTVASRMVDGLQKTTPAKLVKAGAGDAFAVDAWLANWDVVGATFDNMLVQGKRVFRVDTGGALRYRAQGGLKGSAFGDEVLEFQSIRNPGTNPQGAQVFGNLRDVDIERSAVKVLGITDAEIDRLVALHGPRDAIENKVLAERLKARRDDIGRQYPGAKAELDAQAKALAAPEPDTARVTKLEQAEIEASRVNGYAMNTDGTMIEDHAVVVSQMTTSGGQPFTRLFMRLLPDGEAAVAKTMPASVSGAGGYDLGVFRDRLLSLAKSINHRAENGTPMDSTTLLKWSAFKNEAEAAQKSLTKAARMDRAQAATQLKMVDEVHAELLAYFTKHNIGSQVTRIRAIDIQAFKDVLPAADKARKSAAKSALEWEKKTGKLQFETATFDKSHARLTGGKDSLHGVDEYLAAKGEGFSVRYVPSKGNATSAQGMVIIDIEGAGSATTAKGFQIIEKMGVKATRSTAGDRLELYLDRIAYVRTVRNPDLEAAYQAAGKIADATARHEAKLKLLNADAGLDMTKSPYWNPEGNRQAFGHGRVVQYRPDLPPAEIQAFASKHVLYHNTGGYGVGGTSQWPNLKRIIEGGGQIGSQVDRVRRGVPSGGSSVDMDMRSGGGSYIFTRVMTKTKATTRMPAGVHFKADRMMLRTDAFSYDGDLFGAVARHTQEQHRAIDPAGWSRNAKAARNETNFRDAVSLFDDVDRIILLNRAEYNQAIGDLRAMGYRQWPDGRELEDVFGYERP